MSNSTRSLTSLGGVFTVFGQTGVDIVLEVGFGEATIFLILGKDMATGSPIRELRTSSSWRCSLSLLLFELSMGCDIIMSNLNRGELSLFLFVFAGPLFGVAVVELAESLLVDLHVSIVLSIVGEFLLLAELVPNFGYD